MDVSDAREDPGERVRISFEQKLFLKNKVVPTGTIFTSCLNNRTYDLNTDKIDAAGY